VRALITQPATNAIVQVGRIAIRGLAWSGSAPIARVDVSVDGSGWVQARLVGVASSYCWQQWELLTDIERRGPIKIRARATDSVGNVQSEHAEWNRLGYGNNSIQEVVISAI